MDTTTALTFRLLLVVATASMCSCLGDQCSVVHYLAAGEVRDFSFRSGSQFMDNLHCIFSFSAPSDHKLTVAVSDLDMAPASDGSCVDDVLTVYDLTEGELKAISSYCGNNATLNPEIDLSSNVAVVSFVSHESSTPRRFTLTLKAVQQMQQGQQYGQTSEGPKDVETGTEEGGGNGQGGEGNGEEGEEETVIEPEGGGEETGTEPGGGEGEEEGEWEGEGEGEEESEEEEGDKEGDEDEEATGDNRRRGKAVPKILALTPSQRSATSSVQQRAMRKFRQHQDDRQKLRNVLNKTMGGKLKKKKRKTAHAKVSAVGAHPGHNRAWQDSKSDWSLQLQQHTPQPFGDRTKANRQLGLQQRRNTLQLHRRGQTLQPIGKNIHLKMKHRVVKQKQKLINTIR